MAVNRIYCATGLTGGATGALDSIDGINLIDKDMALVINQTTLYIYALDEDSAAAESSPDVISPDTNPVNKRWILQSLHVNDITISDDIILATDDVKIGDTLEVVGNTQFGDADGTGADVTFYSDTAGDTMVYSGSGKTFTLTDIEFISNNVDISAGEIDGTTVGVNSASTGDFTTIGATTPGTIVGTTIDANTDFTVGTTVITSGVITDATLSLAGDVDCTGAHSATTYDADTDFTVGGLVITDGDIADTGILTITPTTSLQVQGAGALGVGTDDTTRGYLSLYGFGAAQTGGGVIDLYTAADHDTTINLYRIQIYQDDLRIGPDTDTDALTYTGADGKFNFNGAAGVDVVNALTAGTVDADSDFTVGGTVISDASIVDDGTLTINATTGVSMTGNGYLYLGSNDVTPGWLRIYGSNAGGAQGGLIDFYNDAGNDDTDEYWRIYASGGNLQIGRAADQDMLVFLEAGTLQSTVAFDVDAALTATTVDADTDFTVGGTVITDATITDDGVFTITAATDINLTNTGGAGANAYTYVGTSDSVRGIVSLRADNDTSGPYIEFQVCPDQDHNGTSAWYIDSVNNTDDLNIGSAEDTDMLRFIGGTHTIQSTVAFDVDAALTATTVDADTDFTVGSTVITDGVITDATGLSIAATTNFNNNAMTNVDINSGAIDGTTIGAASATTGIFTTVNATTDVTLNSDAKLELTMPAADAKATAITIAGQDLDTNAEGTAGRAGGIVYLNSVDTAWDTADHDTLAESGPVLLAMVPTATASADPTTLMTYGLIKETSWSWTVGAVLYLGNAGAMTETAPTTDGEIIRIMGHAVDATTVMFNPSPDWIVYSA
jgi:hypothetical protein